MMLFDISGGRVDPYYSGLWSTGPRGILWSTRKRQDQFAEHGLTRWVPKHLRSDPAVALARLERNWQQKLDLLGALCSWRTLTAEQITALTGTDMGSATGLRIAADLYALGAIDAGFAWSPGQPAMDERTLTIYKLGDARVLRRLIEPLMTYAELVSVTGTGTWRTGGADRHDLLSAELALRVASFKQGVATVLGEGQSRLHDLVYHGPGFEVPPGVTDRPADLTVVRADGARIVFEMTTGRTAGLADKLDAWARALESRTFDQTGVCVVVMVAPDPRRGSVAEIRKAVARAVRMRPGTRSNPTADRLLIADWTEWFPAAGKASGVLYQLRAHRLTGDEWHPVSLADQSHLGAPSKLRDPLAVVDSAAGLRSVPRHLRTDRPNRPRLADLMLEAAGIPTPDVHHSGGVPVGDVPARLRF